MKIVQNLWQVGGGDLTAPEDAAIYLVYPKSRNPDRSIFASTDLRTIGQIYTGRHQQRSKQQGKGKRLS
jgi:hypothetical protein